MTATSTDTESQEETVKYVILIHSNPQPWGHPTQLFTEEGRAHAAGVARPRRP